MAVVLRCHFWKSVSLSVSLSDSIVWFKPWNGNSNRILCRYSKEIPDAYERLLLDAIEGERRLFIRSDELDVAWKLFTPLLKELEDKKITPELYSYGSTGPIEAHNLASKYNVKWGDLSTDNYWWRELDDQHITKLWHIKSWVKFGSKILKPIKF